MKRIDQKDLPYAGAIVQAVLFAIAGNEFFPVPVFGAIVGLGVGAVVNYSLALASSRIADIAEKRKPLARLALVTMFLLSPTTITLSLFYPSTIYAAIAWSICVDLSIILAGTIVGKSLIPQSEVAKVARKKKQVAATTPQPETPLPKVTRKKITDDELLAYLAENKGQSQEMTAAYLGVTRQAVGARIKKLYAIKDSHHV